MLICSASIRENHMFSTGDKNEMEPNPFSFKCLEFTLFSEWYCQRIYLRGCCSRSIQQRRGRDAECRSCSALCKPCPGKMTSCPHLLDNSHKMAQELSFSIQELLQLGWVLPINAPQLPPSSLLACWWCPECWWCPVSDDAQCADDAQQAAPGWGCHIQPIRTWFPAHLPQHKAHMRLLMLTSAALGQEPDLMDCSLFPLLQSHHLTRSHLSFNKGKSRSSFPPAWMLEIN